MELKGKKIAFLGDSITVGVGTSASEYIYWNRIAQASGAECYGYGHNGTRIAPQHIVSVDEPYETLYFASRVETMIPDADIVVILGGTNDYGHGDAALGKLGDKTNDTFYGAYHLLLAELIRHYPDAHLVVMTPLHREKENDLYNSRGIRNAAPFIEYVKAIQEVAESYGVTVVDLYRDCAICPSNPVQKVKYCPDGLHPNDLGHELIARCFLNKMKSL